MLDKLEVVSASGDVLSLPLRETVGGLRVLGVDGLGPTKADISRSNFANLEGSIYYSHRREERNVVLSLGIQPVFGEKTVEEIRRGLYRFFFPGSVVTLKIFTDGALLGTLSGRIETAEPDIFTKDPAFDVSIICFDPDILSASSTLLSGTSSNAESAAVTVEYEGDVEIGILAKLTITSSGSYEVSFRTKGYTGVWTYVSLLRSWTSGDVITIDSRSGQRGATLLRSGVTSSLIPYISSSAEWPKLLPGTNKVMGYRSSSPYPTYTFEYRPRFGGI